MEKAGHLSNKELYAVHGTNAPHAIFRLLDLGLVDAKVIDDEAVICSSPRDPDNTALRLRANQLRILKRMGLDNQRSALVESCLQAELVESTRNV